MSHLRSNYPHPDRIVVGSNNLRKPNSCDESRIKYSTSARHRNTNTPSANGVHIGLGVEPMKLNRARHTTFFNNSVHSHEHHSRNEHALQHFNLNHPMIKEYK